MAIYFLQQPKPNFGDELNRTLWAALLGSAVDRTDMVIAGIGTILDEAIYRYHPTARSFMCLGSGTGYAAPLVDMLDPKWVYRVVRGPLSAGTLGLPRDEACTDGAMLLTQLPDYSITKSSERKGVIFMPHHQALIWPHWESACRDAGVEFLSPLEDIPVIISKLKRAKLVIADAMHAAICADIFRVPWIPVASSTDINAFKWSDWAQSMELEYYPTEIHYGSGFARTLSRLKSFKKRRYADRLFALTDRRLSGLPSRVENIADTANEQMKRFTSKVFKWERAIGLHKAYKKVVADLVSLRDRDGYISDDTVFLMRQREMAEHLRNVRKIIDEVRTDG